MREESPVVSLIYFHVFLPNKVSVCSKNEYCSLQEAPLSYELGQRVCIVFQVYWIPKVRLHPPSGRWL